MKLIILGKDNKPRLNNILDWIIYIFTYTFILLAISRLFDTIEIDYSLYGLYALISAVIIYILNKTLKPILFKITVPITGITMGLFYPCLNILILKITDFLLGSHFDTNGVITLFFTAILISALNLFMEEIIIKPIIKKGGRK